jgi:type I restriction enzyme R subunit
VVFTGNNNDKPLLKQYHLDAKQERQIRKSFCKLDQHPKILIVTEKLLTGFDAPVLYAMYLDKPLRDHTLLQAIARVNRPYENEALEMVKPHGFVLDFVGLLRQARKSPALRQRRGQRHRQGHQAAQDTVSEQDAATSAGLSAVDPAQLQ